MGTDPRPFCRCHNEPMLKNGKGNGRKKLSWRCAVKHRTWKSIRYHRGHAAEHNYQIFKIRLRNRIRYKRKRIAELEKELRNA